MVKGVSDFLVLPLLATFFGALMYFLGARKEMEGGSAPWKWGGVVLMLIGAFSAWGDFSKMLGVGDAADIAIFKSQYDGKKLTFAIYAAFLLPLLSAIGSTAAHFLIRPKSR